MWCEYMKNETPMKRIHNNKIEKQEEKKEKKCMVQNEKHIDEKEKQEI